LADTASVHSNFGFAIGGFTATAIERDGYRDRRTVDALRMAGILPINCLLVGRSIGGAGVAPIETLRQKGKLRRQLPEAL
jgi:hypothetical protein